jgi:SAM-dependent methyltransferase
VPVAQRIRGTLHTFDIEAKMVETALARVAASGLTNVRGNVRDGIANGFGLSPKSVDAVLLFNILHGENPTQMLSAAAELLRPGGRILAIHWRSDIPTPRGPDVSIRPRAEQIATWGSSAGLQPQAGVLLLPWHFGLVLER